MTLTQFLDKAIEGGWLETIKSPVPADWMDKGQPIEVMMLDPLAWKAVGNAVGWVGKSWKHHFWKMAVELSNGKTIEEYIETL